MSLPVFLFVLIAAVIVGLLAWATRPPRVIPYPVEDIFELLSQQRHCARLHIILQALHPEDTEYLRKSGNPELMHSLRRQRRHIALRYLEELQLEFETLLEISRAMAVMAPEVVPLEEMQRWRLSLVFALKCVLLRWRLRLGLQPLSGFAMVSGMATELARLLETATSSIAEGAVRTVDLPYPDHGSQEHD